MHTSSHTQVLCVRVHSWLIWPPQIKEVVCGHEKSAHQCAGTAWNLAWSKSQAFEDTLQDSNVAIMCSNVSAIAYLRNQGWGHSVSMMCHTACKWTGKRFLTLRSRPCPGHLIWLLRHQRSDSENRMESESSHGMACSPSLGQFSSRASCIKRNPKLATYTSLIIRIRDLGSWQLSQSGEVGTLTHTLMACIRDTDPISPPPPWLKQRSSDLYTCH